jgi:quinol monooxygenase YgiN
MAAAPPYVTYSSCTFVTIPAADWDYLYGSLQALKAHVQEYPGCVSFDLFAHVDAENVVVHSYTTWDTAEQLEAYLERGYTLERFLDDVEGVTPDQSLLMEKIF